MLAKILPWQLSQTFVSQIQLSTYLILVSDMRQNIPQICFSGRPLSVDLIMGSLDTLPFCVTISLVFLEVFSSPIKTIY